MTHSPVSPAPIAPRRRPLGFSPLALVGLAAVALPRVILHDLHLIAEGSPITWLLAVGPVALWIAVSLAKRVPNPFLTVLVIGAVFGVMLVVTHQLLWDVAFQGAPPTLGEGRGGALIPRIAAIPSGLFTGAMIGAIGGLVAWGLQSLIHRRR